MDAVAAVDNQNKSITMKAVYVVHPMSYSQSEISQMQTDINSTLNSQNYSVSEGAYAGYSVNFDLQFVEQDFNNNQKENFSVDGNPIGNNFANDKAPGMDKFVNPVKRAGNGGIKTVYRGGNTIDQNNIIMNSTLGGLQEIIHEIFHTLYLNKDGANSGVHSYDNPGLPNQDDINETINNNELPKVTK